MGGRGEAGCQTLGDPGLAASAETCPGPLCSLLQGLPTEEDFSEVLTQVHEVGSPRPLQGRECVQLSSSVSASVAVGVMA